MTTVSNDNWLEWEPGDVGTTIHGHPNDEVFAVEFMALDDDIRAICNCSIVPGVPRIWR